MKYKTLGNTGLQVSELCLGAMIFGSLVYHIGEVDQDLAQEMVQAVWEAGVNFFDTADVYSRGDSEQMLWQAIPELGIDRRQAVIATKVRGAMSDAAADGNSGVNNVGLSQNISWNRLMPAWND